MIGRIIQNYKIEKLIGEGGMGMVYLATHQRLGRQAAIKSLHTNLSSNTQIRSRFVNEAATLEHLKHPNIVMLYDYVEDEQGLYLIMEYVKGQELGEHIERVSGPINTTRTLYIFKQLLDAFGYAHSQNVIHRDIKPSNILLAQNDLVKVLDFGIARILNSENSTNLALTSAGMRLGTALYMSPEQVKGLPADIRSDIYSLGMVLFEMLTGQRAYHQATMSEFDVHVKIVNEPLPRAKSIYPGVADWLQIVLDTATAKDPKYRYQDCGQFARALQQAAASAGSAPTKPPTKATPPPIPRPITPPPLPKPASLISKNLSAAPAHVAAKSKSPSKSPMSSILLILLFVLGAVALIIITRKSNTQAESPLNGGSSSGAASQSGQPKIPNQDSIDQENQKKELQLEEQRAERQATLLAAKKAEKQAEILMQQESLIHEIDKTEALPPCNYETQIGICAGEINIKNNSQYMIEKVLIEIRAQRDQENFTPIQILFENIAPGQEQHLPNIEAQEGSEFVSIIIGIECSALNYVYSK